MKPMVFGAACRTSQTGARRRAPPTCFARPAGSRSGALREGADSARRDVEVLRQYGVRAHDLDRDALTALEPNVSELARGGIHFPDPLSTPDPQGLARAYAALFVKQGGRFEKGDARTLRAESGRWTVTTEEGDISAADVVVALGPWSNDLVEHMGLKLPFFVKRGYHKHYAPRGNQGLNRPVLDLEKGYMVVPMALGLRLTTGAEFARLEDPPSSAHIDRLEPFAREMFPIGEARETEPWLGRRPCLPDMRPIIGPFPGKPGLWLDFGHQHLGLTLGPISGRLLAEMIAGETPFVDPAPFRAERFG